MIIKTKKAATKYLIENGAPADVVIEKSGGYWWIVSREQGVFGNTYLETFEHLSGERWLLIWKNCTQLHAFRMKHADKKIVIS